MVKQTSSTVVPAKRSWAPNYKLPVWMMRCKYYMLEFLLALIGLTVSVFLLDRAFFVLANYLVDYDTTLGKYDQMNLVIVAMGVIWLPLALLFYKRSRFEELNRPLLASTKLRRFFLYIFMLGTMGAAIGFATAAVLSVLRMLFGTDEFAETVLKVTIPSLFATWLHVMLFRTFMRQNTPIQIRAFSALLGGIGTLLLIGLLVATGVQARGALVDEKISQDLGTISTKVNDYYREKNKLPSSLKELSLDKAVLRRADKHGYAIEKKTGSAYRLCADFKTKGTGNNHEFMAAKVAIYPNPSNGNFTLHDKGRYCFDLTAGIFMPYEDTMKPNDSSGSPTSPSGSSDYNSLFEQLDKSNSY